MSSGQSVQSPESSDSVSVESGAQTRLIPSLRQRVAALIEEHGPTYTLEQAAQVLELHPRALQRRLRRKNVTFRELVAESRKKDVLDAVALGQKPVHDIAKEAGFTSIPGFYKAFRRWTDTTPNRWRQTKGDPAATKEDPAPSAQEPVATAFGE